MRRKLLEKPTRALSPFTALNTNVNKLHWFYDNNNQLHGYKENNNVYFYIRDVLGNIINQTGTIISNFRYKGYYYDSDLELYYLKSRFYNPVLLRFITPDSIEYLDSSSIIGLNLYAYCGNDPVNMKDEEGNLPNWANWLIGGIIIAGAIVASVYTAGAAGALVGTLLGQGLLGL